jgi:class 3 adenylate cyclase
LLIEIARFLSGNASGLAPVRHVSAILFTDVVDSTQRAADEGDEAWRDLLDLHDAAVRRCVEQRGGRVVKYTGDGVFALLPSVSAALEVVRSIRDEVGNRGMRLRAGVHVGDVDVRGDDVSGIAVNATARIMGLADADETLVSEPARLAALGSGLDYGARRTTSLKGVPEEWTLSPWLRA